MYEEDKDLLLETLQQHKRTAFGGVAVLLTLLLLLFGWEGPETSAGDVERADSPMRSELEQGGAHEGTEAAETGEGGSAKAVRTPAKQGSSRSGHSIRGAEKASMGEVLTDPFSMRHEKREEARRRAEHSEPAISGKSQATPVAAEPEPQQMTGQEASGKGKMEPCEPVHLQGIVTGERGSVAILKKGEKSYALSVGENLAGRVIAAIGTKEVEFADGEKLTLSLP